MDKSDGLTRAVLNYLKNCFPKLQNKTKGKASEGRSNQKSSLIGTKTVTNDDATLNMINVYYRLEENYDQMDMSIKERLMSLLNFGLFKEGVRDVKMTKSKQCNQELPKKNVVYWTKKNYLLKLHITYLLYKEPNEVQGAKRRNFGDGNGSDHEK
jgi:hypothetical protein